MKNVKKISTVFLATAILTTSCPVFALTKDETVYSKLNSDGSVKKTVVSEYLKNTDDKIIDKTDLKNILNLNGTEKYKLDGTNLVWDAKGKDIYYQGETNKELPVSLSIEYKLDGKKIELKDLLGKKGNVEITLNYINHDVHNVLVNGKYETLYTPFVVTMGTSISNTTNSNIKVTNGRIVSNGKNSVVVAIASPGLSESLNTDKLKDFDKITISFDTKSFELSSIYSVISSKLINKDDLDVFHKFDSMYSKIDTLSNSSKQLVEGSNKILDGSKELNNGINKAYNGSKLLNDTLNKKINELENSEAIDNTKLNYISNLAVNGAVKTVEAKEEDIKANALTSYIEKLNKKIEYIETVKPDIKGLIELCTADPTNDACTTSDAKQYLGAKKIQAALLNDETKALVNEIAGEIAYGASKQTASETAKGVSNLVATEVANQAKETTLESLKLLNTNINTLTKGLYELNVGSTTLTNGVNTLTDGITKFDNEGISKVANLVNGDVKTTQSRLEALMKLGKAYDSFTMKDSNTDSETKFVLMTQSEKKVVKAENKKVTTKKKESLVDKIKKIF